MVCIRCPRTKYEKLLIPCNGITTYWEAMLWTKFSGELTKSIRSNVHCRNSTTEKRLSDNLIISSGDAIFEVNSISIHRKPMWKFTVSRKIFTNFDTCNLHTHARRQSDRRIIEKIGFHFVLQLRAIRLLAMSQRHEVHAQYSKCLAYLSFLTFAFASAHFFPKWHHRFALSNTHAHTHTVRKHTRITLRSGSVCGHEHKRIERTEFHWTKSHFSSSMNT